MTFIAVDPGGSCLAYAVFVDGTLVEAGLSRTVEKCTFERARVHRAFIATLRTKYATDVVVCEAMWWVKRRGAPAQDLVNLNLIAGAVGTEWYLPHTWKGKLPKEVHHPRVWAALHESEKAIAAAVMPKYLRHNSTDAVGIGLFHLGRLTPCTKLLISSTMKTLPKPPARLSRAPATRSASPAARTAGAPSRGRSSKRTKRSSTPSTRSTRIRVVAALTALRSTRP